MSLKQTLILAVALIISYASGVVTGQTERLELLGNMKLFGAGNGIIFPDGTKQSSAGVGTSNDVTCAAPCVGVGEIAANAVGSAEVADNTLTANDLGPDSVGTSEVADNTLTANDLATDSVGAAEIAASAVGTSEVADNTLTANDLATDSVGAAEIAANAVGTSEVADNTLTSDDLATDSVAAAEIAASAVGTSEVADNTLTSDDLATDSVAAAEIAANAVGTSEVANNTLTSDDLADASVNSNEVVNKSLRLTDLNATVTMNYQYNIFLTINNGSCTGFTGNGVGGVAANSYVLVFGVRLDSTGGPATGWVVEAENTPTGVVDTVKLRICNFTGANADPPDLRINFWTIAQ